MPGDGADALLSLRKAALRLRIAQRRARLVAECQQIAEPLYVADAWFARAQRLRFLWPILQTFVFRAKSGSGKPFAGIRKLAKWAPIVLKVFRAARSARADRHEEESEEPTYADRDE